MSYTVCKKDVGNILKNEKKDKCTQNILEETKVYN